MTISAGSVLLESLLPTGAPVHNLDSHKVDELVSDIVEKDPEHAHKYVSMLGKLFFNAATEKGYSIGLEDYENKDEERRQILGNFEREVQQIMASRKDKKQKYAEISELAANAQKTLSTQNLHSLLNRNKTSALMAYSGARGNPGQLMQAAASPLLGADSNGDPVPLPIRHSYAEGLSLGETAAMSFGARHNTVMAQLSTSKPGAIFKWLSPNLFHEVVTEKDCGTKHGSVFPIQDRKSVLYRVQAGTNKVVTPTLLQEEQREGKTSIEVRTPLTCQAREGICQYCYGYDAEKRFPEIGTNVGVQSAQAVSEKLTQSILGTKHTGGLAGKKKDTYAMANNFLMNPEKFLDEATISTKPGEVNSVEKTVLGDHIVHIGGKEHYVPSVQDVLVKAGDKVREGQALSTGTINPRQLIEHKGMLHTRKYYADTLRDIYTGGHENSLKMGSLDPRHFEIIARNMIKYVEVEDPGDTMLHHGEVVDVAKLKKILDHKAHKEPVKDSVGKVLAATGETITPEMARTMEEEGHKEVEVSDVHIKVKPLVKGLKTNKLMDPNWVSRLSYNNIKKVLRDAVEQGDRSPLHGYDPIMPYVMGTEFGEGPKAQY